VTQYQSKIQDAKRYGLIKDTFDFKSTVDDRFLKQALKDLNLENYWKPVDATGKPKS
jgi:sulfonate transport system substrate-binding protein